MNADEFIANYEPDSAAIADMAAIRKAERRAAREAWMAHLEGDDSTCDQGRCCSRCKRHVMPHVGCILR